MKWLNMIDDKLLLNVSRICVFLMMILIAADAFGRYLFNHPLSFVTKVVTDLFMPVIVFLGMSYSIRVSAHVKVDFFIQNASDSLKKVLEIIFNLLSIFLCVLISYCAFVESYQALISNQRSIGVFGIPPFISYGIVGIGGLFAVLRLLFILMTRFKPSTKFSGKID